MNSQQELLDAINTISQKKERSFDTPATVLRVEGDTVWVHIDGGADETPVNKTISCAEGETVQVRIANGSAFLVGNASAPPTDDKTANVAHFVAEQADEKATSAEEKAVEAIRSVEAIEQTVEDKVDSGNSNITDISSTMYQDAYGVNIFNDTLAVGDSYAHIDGDSFDIKEATTAGVIDNTNDPIVASFGADGVVIKSSDANSENTLTLSAEEMSLIQETQSDVSGWGIKKDRIYSRGQQDVYQIFLDKSIPALYIGPSNTGQTYVETYIRNNIIYIDDHANEEHASFYPNNIILSCDRTSSESEIQLFSGDIFISGDVYGEVYSGGSWLHSYKKTPTILESTTISASTTSYTFTDDAITADSTIDVYDSIFGFAPSNISTSAGSCTITFPAQSSSHKIRLFVY